MSPASAPIDPSIAGELETALQARREGREGRARVCARRAAGLAARAYLARQGYSMDRISAFDALQQLRGHAGLPEAAETLLEHLTRRVDSQFSLPLELDLLEDARQLVDLLR